MTMKVTITPKFSSSAIYKKSIERNWIQFQWEIMKLGDRMLIYMRSYIDTHRHRARKNGPSIIDAINIDKVGGAGTAMVSWGIGNISSLQSKAPYWYVLNYGKTVGGERFVPNNGAMTMGAFDPSGRPDSEASNGAEAWRGGAQYGMTPKRPIRPINYIQATRSRMGLELRVILSKGK